GRRIPPSSTAPGRCHRCGSCGDRRPLPVTDPASRSCIARPTDDFGPRFAQQSSARLPIRIARLAIPPTPGKAHFQSRPISEKKFVILECKEPFQNTKLSPWNGTAKLPGPPATTSDVLNLKLQPYVSFSR